MSVPIEDPSTANVIEVTPTLSLADASTAIDPETSAASVGAVIETVGAVFPDHCIAGGNLTKQEKVLLYMLFDLATCVGDTPPPPVCTPTTCEELDLECGFSGDGCGGVLDCGPCKIKGPR